MSAPGPTFEGTATVARANVARALLPVLAIASTALFLFDRGSFGFPLILFVAGFSRKQRAEERLLVDARGLWQGKKLVVRRAELRDAWVLENAPAPTVFVGTAQGPSREYVFGRRDEAVRFAAAVAPAPATVVAGTVSDVVSFLGTLPVLTLLAAAFAMSGAISLKLLAMLLLVGAVIQRLRTSRLTVGHDGFEVATAVERRFVRYADVATVDGARVTLRDGRTIALGPRRFDGPTTLGKGARAELRTRAEGALRERVAAHHEEAVRGVEAPAIALGAPSAYREASPSPEALLPLVESGATEPDVRVRVAATLARDATLDEAQRLRLRIAAAGTVDREVRERLFESLEGSDDRVVRRR